MIPYLESFQSGYTAEGSELAPARSTDERLRLFGTLDTSTRLASLRLPDERLGSMASLKRAFLTAK
jgi:hypothetical protein